MIKASMKLNYLSILTAVVMSACASNKPTYSIVVPVASSDVFIAETKLGSHSYEIRYKTDAQGKRIIKTVDAEGNYTGGGRESYDEVLSEAKARMTRNAIDQVNGVFISAKTEIVQKSFSNGGQSASYEDFKEETLSKVMGIAHYQGQPNCQRKNSEAGTTKIRCLGRVEVPVVDIVTVN